MPKGQKKQVANNSLTYSELKEQIEESLQNRKKAHLDAISAIDDVLANLNDVTVIEDSIRNGAYA